MNTTSFPPDPPAPSGILVCFRSLIDPRVERKCDHLLGDILVIGLLTLLCGGESFKDMEDFGLAKQDWLRTFLRLPHGIPSHDTFNRLFSALDPKAFLDCFPRWTHGVRQTVSEEVVALEGKALRRIVTADAMGCQKTIAREIRKAQAHYVLALKGNQETVHAEVKAFLDDAVDHDPKALAYYETTEKDHGRIEIRRYWQADRLDWFEDLSKWEGLASVGMVESERQIPGREVTLERRYFLCSLPLGAKRFAGAVRGHWSIENSLHWVLDVQFGEDQCRARSGYAAENLAALRRLALNLLKRETTKKRGIKGKQKNAGWDHSYLLRLLGLSVSLDGPAEAGEPSLKRRARPARKAPAAVEDARGRASDSRSRPEGRGA